MSRKKAIRRREGTSIRPQIPRRRTYSGGEAAFVLAWVRVGFLFECWAEGEGTVRLQILIDALNAVRDPWESTPQPEEQGRAVAGEL